MYAARGRLIPFNSNSPDWLDLHGVLDCDQHPRADEDLSRLGLVAKPRSNIGHRTDSGIVEAALEADGAERRKAVRDADAEANVMPKPTPFVRQRSDGVAHFKRHEHRLERRVLYWHWIIEDHHHAVTSIAFERAVVLDDDFADGRVVVAQQGHHVFRVGAFSEPGEAAQVAEERGNLSAMAFQLLLAPRRHNQISHLRRQEAPQPAHALDFVYLVGDAMFKLLV